MGREGGAGGIGLRGQGGCEWRSEAFVKIKIIYFFLGGVGAWVRGGGGRVGSGWMGTEK